MAMTIALCAASAACAQSMPSGQLPNPAIVRIIAPERDGMSLGSGTLVAVNDTYGLVVTNWHVVRDAAAPVWVAFPNGFRSAATILKTDRDWDLAALAVWRPNVSPLPLAAQPPRPGERLTIAGYGSGCVSRGLRPMHPICFPGRKSSLRDGRIIRPCTKRRFRRTNSQRPRRNRGRPVRLGLWPDHRQLLWALAIFFIIRGRRFPTPSRPTGCYRPTAIDPSRPARRYCRTTFFIRVRIKQCTGFRLEGEYSVFKRKYQKTIACFNGNIRQIAGRIYPYCIVYGRSVLVRSDTKLSGCNRHSRGIDPRTACGEKTGRLARIGLVWQSVGAMTSLRCCRAQILGDNANSSMPCSPHCNVCPCY